jgi:hypothetical protein
VDKHETKMAFDDTVVITAHGYDRKFVEEFEMRFSKLTGIISNHVRSLFLWFLGVSLGFVQTDGRKT